MAPDEVSTTPSRAEGFTVLLADYERHLTAERDLSKHSVRAYMGDVMDLIEHLTRLGHDDLSGLDIRGLRSWLAKQQSLGKSRSTMARRATAARVFTAWAQRTGRIETDPGALLASPKPHKSLPGVLGQAETRAVLDAAAVAADDGSPVGLRDLAIMELLYATGIRVGELCAIDLDDVDPGRRVIRVFGKGRKERSVPYGVPAGVALDGWLDGARPKLFRPDRSADRPAACARPDGGGRRAGPLAARDAAHGGDAPARRRRGPAQRAGVARSRFVGDDPDLHPRVRRPVATRVRTSASARLTSGLDTADCGLCGFRRSLTMRCGR
jgi:site-specific recombinase XerD